jgi:hypothetical protein
MKTPLDRVLSVITTTRNWKTVSTLHQMCWTAADARHVLSANRFRSSRHARVCAFAALLLRQADPNTLVMMIESSPTNLDPRIGVDAQSERIDNLIFDDLLSAAII